MKRRLIALFLGMSLGITMLTGCGAAQENTALDTAKELMEADAAKPEADKAADPAKTEEKKAEDETAAKADEEKKADTAAEDKKEESAATAEPFVSDRSEVFEFLSGMNVGWNLGNTFDSKGVGNTVTAETAWGNPKTTQEMIDAIAKQGFNTIRIPITWAEHVGAAPDYTIDKAWLDRVEEVVGYAMNCNMYVMINTHHEEDHWLITEPANTEKVKAELTAIWRQVAERFRDYNEYLIFEGMNEPRKVGSEKEWSGGTPEERVMINELNQAFVDTVRATGGNNEKRLLVICPYGNNPGNKALAELAIPEDNHIAVAIHMYTPYVFTYVPDKGSLTTWDGTKKAEIVNTIKQIDEYLLQKDVPVIITEFGAQNKENVGEIVKWLEDYMGAMNRYGLKCFWWDNGFYYGTGNERFAIFDRRNLTWFEPDIADALVRFSVTG